MQTVSEQYRMSRTAPEQMFGPKGFTETEEVRSILEPHGHGMYDTEYQRFYLPAPALVAVARYLPAKHAENAQNNAPTFGDFVALAQLFPALTFECYRIGSTRNDERLTVEGFVGPDHIFRDACEVLARHRPDCWPPDEYQREGHRVLGRCWWD